MVTIIYTGSAKKLSLSSKSIHNADHRQLRVNETPIFFLQYNCLARKLFVHTINKAAKN